MSAVHRSHFHYTRRGLRLAAVWGLVALCMHLAGMGVSAFHATARLAQQSVASDHCAVASAAHADEAEKAAHHGGDGSQHCPLCVFQANSAPLIVAVLSLLLPAEGGIHDYCVADKTAPHAAPHARHAPPRAPPVLFV